MKSFRHLILMGLAAVALAIAGCSSVDVATTDSRRFASVRNSGWFLFGFIPIASGDPEYVNQEVCLWCCDSLTLEVNQMILDEAARKAGASGYRNLTSYMTSEPVFLFLFKRKIFNTSAELIY